MSSLILRRGSCTGVWAICLRLQSVPGMSAAPGGAAGVAACWIVEPPGCTPGLMERATFAGGFYFTELVSCHSKISL